MKKIAFYSNQLSIRGTEIALYTYAKYNEEILGNKSIIISNPNSDLSSLPKFKERFDVELLPWYDVENYLLKNGFDFLYIIKMGIDDGYCLNTIPTLIHVVFRFNQPHGFKYFYVSDWLCKHQGYDPKTHSLPHICEPLPLPNYSFREKNNIPKDSVVFGSYGGSTEFNIDFVKSTISKIVRERNDIFFIFMNILPFDNHENIKFFDGTYDLYEKSSFVNSCNAMIHGRYGGETFGLSISEFALANKPIITYELSEERSHLEILKERAITYKNDEEVYDILTNLKKYTIYDDYDTPYKIYSPELIMEKFKSFLT